MAQPNLLLMASCAALLVLFAPLRSSSQSIRLGPPPGEAKLAQPTAGSVKPASSAVSRLAQLQQPAPDFTLSDTDGNPVALHTLRGKIVVLEWFNPDCPFIKHAHSAGPLKDLAKRVASERLVWLSINSGGVGKQGNGLTRNRAAKGEYGIENALLLDESGEVGKLYGAEKTPHIFIIDAKGKLVYRGGLDNAPMGVVDDARPRSPKSVAGTLEAYAENALNAIKQGKKPPLSETPAYGCSVKYGS